MNQKEFAPKNETCACAPSFIFCLLISLIHCRIFFRSVSTAKYAVKWWWCFNRSSSALLLRRKLFSAFCFMSSLFHFLSPSLSFSFYLPHFLLLFLEREWITHTLSFSRRSRFQCGDGMFALKFTLSQTIFSALLSWVEKKKTTTTICLSLFFVQLLLQYIVSVLKPKKEKTNKIRKAICLNWDSYVAPLFIHM